MVSTSFDWLRNNHVLTSVVCLLLILTGCGKQSQSKAISEPEREDLAEVFAAQQKVIAAENALIAYVKSDTEHQWIQHEFGWWYRYEHKGEDHKEYNMLPPADTLTHTLHEVVCDMSGKMRIDVVRRYKETQDEPLGYQIMVRELVPQDTLVLLLPWNMAFGPKGNQYVSEYENLLIRLTLSDDKWYDAKYELED